MLTITPAGVVSDLSKDSFDEAKWDDACIHIFPHSRSVIVSVNFSRVSASAIAAALYVIVDLRPTKITLFGSDNNISKVLGGFQSGFQRLCEIFNIILSEEDEQMHIDGRLLVESERDEAICHNNGKRNRTGYH